MNNLVRIQGTVIEVKPAKTALITQEINEEANRQTIHQPYEAQEKQAERQLIQKLQVKIKQLEAEAQQ
ncbi:20010_t:CDS:2 [Entrophospora sp. SA101]|nr:11524_t:CDS:2 [Entrophospora sp. SA101]CAJ0747087.1 20010_t:CDS:2 [Entrophospora sp. SA101]